MKRHWLALALTVVGCFGPDENVLFERDGASGGSVAGAGAGSLPNGGAQSGTDSGQYVSGAPTAGSGGAGAAGSAPSGGSAGSSALGGNGGSGGDAPPTPAIESCDMITGSVVSPSNGHCYRVNEDKLTFAEASEACKVAAGHLLTVGSAEENAFARGLREGDQWLGATDERANEVAGVGTYVWVTGEPWEFSDWEEGQPNAFETDCPNDDDADCYEHCAFQSPEGDWNDRSCWHTIASICEWDVKGPAGEGGAAGSGGAPDGDPNRPNGPD